MNIKKYLSFFDKIFRNLFAGRPYGGRDPMQGLWSVTGRMQKRGGIRRRQIPSRKTSGRRKFPVSKGGFGLGRGMFFGFRLSCLVLAVGFVRKSGPCLYIVRKKAPAYVTGPAIFCPGVLHLHENSLHLYGPSDDFGFRSQKIGPGGCSAWFCGALFYVPYLT